MKKINILANDGLEASAVELLEKNNFQVYLNKIPQELLSEFINRHSIEGLIVRSATQVRKNLIDSCPTLRIIARAGVGTDNIDVEYAKGKGISVVNTPASSSRSVAELVLAHLMGALRFLHQSNRQMPVEGNEKFNGLKQNYSTGREVLNKTLGIIGFGRIGQQVASMAAGLGMKILAYDPYVKEAVIPLNILGIPPITLTLKTTTMENVLESSDFITLHVPSGKLIGNKEIQTMKNQVILINASRGGVIDEDALLHALNVGKVAHACLDVFENEPHPNPELLKHPNVSASPHIGASTLEAQERIGQELADKLIAFFQHHHA